MEHFLDFLMRHWFLSGTFLLLLLWLSQTTANKIVQGVEMLTSLEAINKVNHEQGYYIDIRSVEQFAKGHIVNSHNIAVDALADQIKNVTKNKKRPIIMVCAAGRSAVLGAKKIQALGYEKVYVLQGGLQQWQADEFPVMNNNNKQ